MYIYSCVVGVTVVRFLGEIRRLVFSYDTEYSTPLLRNSVCTYISDSHEVRPACISRKGGPKAQASRFKATHALVSDIESLTPFSHDFQDIDYRASAHTVPPACILYGPVLPAANQTAN